MGVPEWTPVSANPGPTQGSTRTDSLPSSILSSSQVGDTATLDDGDFEAISLDDDQPPANPPVMAATTTTTTSRRPRPKLAPLMAVSPLNRSPQDTTHSPRDLLKAPLPKRPSVPSIKTGLSASQLGLPKTNGSLRRLNSPSVPSLIHSSSRSATSRDPSPHRADSLTSVPRSAHPVLYGSQPRPSPTHRFKHFNWQPTRKTAKEIEASYDSDDEIPFDSILHNVPLTPLPGGRLSLSNSPDRSPERYGPSSRKSLTKTHSLPVNGHSTNNQSQPKPIARGFTTPAVSLEEGSEVGHLSLENVNSRQRGRRDSRTKSWTDAMDDLSMEVQDLTEKLDQHAEELLQKEEQILQTGGASSRPRTPTTAPLDLLKLPPKQVRGVELDPVPISKEKEAVLSRTRPSWLPPKSKIEERKHLKEYQKMMRLSYEADKRKEQRDRRDREVKDQIQDDMSKVWEKMLQPGMWEPIVKLPQTRELWWQGVAPRYRAPLWQRAIGNELAITEDTFKIALKRAQEVERGSHPSINGRQLECQSALKRDIVNTLPELKIFQDDGPLHDNLRDILMAYSIYRGDIGYVFGINTIAALLLLNMGAPEAFACLANLLNRPIPQAFYTQDEPAMSKTYDIFLSAFKYKLPSLYTHIHVNQCMAPPLYLESIFSTMFALPQCPIDIISRMWDVYVFEGDKFLIRAGVAVLTALEGHLYGDRADIEALMGWNATKMWELGKENDFMNLARDAGREEPTEL